LDGGEAVLLGVEDARRPAVDEPVVARELHDAAVRREVAPEDPEAAARLQRTLDRDHHLLAGALVHGGSDLPERAPVDVPGARGNEIALRELAGDERDAAGLV